MTGRRRATVWVLRVGLLAVVLGAWAYATGPGGASALILPQIPQVFHALASTTATAAFWHACEVTLAEIGLAFVLSVVGGVGLGLFAGRTSSRAAVIEPLVSWVYMAPLVLFYPLFTLWFGVGIWSKVLYGAVGGLLPVAFNTIRGFRRVDGRYLLVGRAFGASHLQTDMVIKFGAALPMVLSGIRIGAALNIISVVLAEMLAAEQGLGYDLARFSQTLDLASAFAMIIVLLVIVAILQTLIGRATRRRF